MKTDRRVKKSKKAIQEALVDLLEKNDFTDITVQEISDLADINRSTFYSHYVDKYALLKEIEDEKIEDIRSFVRTSIQNKTNKQFTEGIVKDIMVHLIQHIGNNRQFYNVMFRIDKDSQIEQKLFDLIYEHHETYASKEGNINDIPFDYFISYVAGISIIKHWVMDAHRISEEQLIDHFYNIVSMGTANLIDTTKKSSSH